MPIDLSVKYQEAVSAAEITDIPSEVEALGCIRFEAYVSHFSKGPRGLLLTLTVAIPRNGVWCFEIDDLRACIQRPILNELLGARHLCQRKG
jgi:hypothetical protein